MPGTIPNKASNAGCPETEGYKFWFYSADLDEPAHVHVGRGGKLAKDWLQPLRVARAGRARPEELREIERIYRGPTWLLDECLGK